jgi:hypothetical protein
MVVNRARDGMLYNRYAIMEYPGSRWQMKWEYADAPGVAGRGNDMDVEKALVEKPVKHTPKGVVRPSVEKPVKLTPMEVVKPLGEKPAKHDIVVILFVLVDQLGTNMQRTIKRV